MSALRLLDRVAETGIFDRHSDQVARRLLILQHAKRKLIKSTPPASRASCRIASKLGAAV